MYGKNRLPTQEEVSFKKVESKGVVDGSAQQQTFIEETITDVVPKMQ